ncbi:hypothetical protein [Isoptericola sp. NPDC019482]|uniref:hypothetical protein n=1 Tax=Isoptericola sp. NPDC019482 TaxID=3154688 RepID=UPI0034837B1B
MTYGEVNADLRAAIVDLLSYRRITFYLGRAGNGRAPAWGTPEQARASADLIQRYRAIVWTYAGRLLQTALPPGGIAPAWNLPWRLDERITEMAPEAERLPAGRAANTNELGTRQEIGLVEVWRRTAAAAVAGLDRELGALGGDLDRGQRFVLVKDAAELVYALIRLDDRYRHAPNWRLLGDRNRHTELARKRRSDHLRQPIGIVSTALETVRWAEEQITADAYAVDQAGWRSRPRLVVPTAVDHVDRAIDYLHNAAVHLQREFPRALALRALSRLNRLVALQASRLAASACLGECEQWFDARAKTYADLNVVLRTSVGGNLGRGDRAVADATVALDLLSDANQPGRDRVLRLSAVLNDVDNAFGARLQEGVEDERYFQRTGRHLAMSTAIGVHRSADTYERLVGPARDGLLIVATDLQAAGEGVSRAPDSRRALTTLSASVADSPRGRPPKGAPQTPIVVPSRGSPVSTGLPAKLGSSNSGIAI